MHMPAYTTRNLLLAASLVSAAMLSAAFIAQYGFGLYPCELCILQRYPYAGIMALGLLGRYLIRSERMRYYLVIACIALFLVDAGIAFYHAGVEAGLFKAPDACASDSSGGLSLEEMRRAIMNAPLVTCDQAMTHIFGLSLAAWNAIAAFLFAIAIAIGLRRVRKGA
jgi:disulfide bond formation protein DsbB